jgi:hypothetical protein
MQMELHTDPCRHGNIFGCPQCVDNEKKRKARRKAKDNASSGEKENLEKQKVHKDKSISKITHFTIVPSM